MESHRRASLKDVATLAGTSVATASRAVNSSGYVAEETRTRVLEAAHKLGYQPNLKARALRKNDSKSIGLIIPNLLNTYYATFADVVTRILSEKGYHLLLFSTRDDEENEETTIYDVMGHAVEGFLWVPAGPEGDLLDHIQQQNIPAVSLVRRVEDNRIDTVVFQDFDGSKTATEHLITLGHRRIGFIGGDMRYSSNAARWEGYIAAHEAAGIAVDETLVKLGTNRDMWGKMASADLFVLPTPPTALFVASNALMPGVINSIRHYAIDVPGQLSLICFDDIDWFSYSVPPISAVKNGPEDLAEMALNLLFRRIDGSNDPPSILMELEYELVLRQSTAPPRGRS